MLLPVREGRRADRQTVAAGVAMAPLNVFAAHVRCSTVY